MLLRSLHWRNSRIMASREPLWLFLYAIAEQPKAGLIMLFLDIVLILEKAWLKHQLNIGDCWLPRNHFSQSILTIVQITILHPNCKLRR